MTRKEKSEEGKEKAKEPATRALKKNKNLESMYD